VAVYAFLGPLLGSIVRPFGGWLSDKFGGAMVTQFNIGVMTGSAVGNRI
jgi:NNP family nitrate/nitrite transporter-like MFS transporter